MRPTNSKNNCTIRDYYTRSFNITIRCFDFDPRKLRNPIGLANEFSRNSILRVLVNPQCDYTRVFSIVLFGVSISIQENYRAYTHSFSIANPTFGAVAELVAKCIDSMLKVRTSPLAIVNSSGVALGERFRNAVRSAARASVSPLLRLGVSRGKASQQQCAPGTGSSTASQSDSN